MDGTRVTFELLKSTETAYRVQLAALAEQARRINELRTRREADRMLSAHGRQITIFGDGRASVTRGQLSGSISQAAIEADNFHSKVTSDYTEILEKVQVLGRELTETETECKSLAVLFPHDTQFQQMCSGLSNTKRTYQRQAQTMQGAFAESERIWNEERRKQEGVERAADQAVR